MSEFGGRVGILNIGALESALARPYSGYYPKIEQKAAALVESLAQNHAFADGNKRTAVLMLRVLLKNSGYDLRFSITEIGDDEIEGLVLRIVTHETSFADAVRWLKAHIMRV